MNILLLLETVAAIHGERVALIGGASRFSYRELLERALGLGASLGPRAQGKPILFVGTNGPAFVELLFGAAAAGVPLIPANFRSTQSEFEHVLRSGGAQLAITDARYVSALRSAARMADIELEILDTDAFARLADSPAEPPADPGDVAVGLFTSGTTGPARLVHLTHANLASYVLDTVDPGSAGDDEAALLSAPAYHVAAIANTLSSLYRGRRLVLLPQFDADDWVRWAVSERITHAMVVPTMLARILDVIERDQIELPSLRSLSYGGSKAPEQLVRRALERLSHVDFVNAYGLTETSSTVTLLDPQDHRDALRSGDPVVQRRLRSVGRPLPGIELQIREGDAVLNVGEVGRVCLRGEQIAAGYADGRPAVDAQGWLVTGDNGFVDDGGYLYIVDRVDDVIIRGGENISPDEIEETLRRHPLVEDAAVVGVADPQWGQVVVAAYEGGEAAESSLQAWVRADLAGYKVPVRIRRFEALPRNALGKILRRVVAREMS